MTNTMLEDKAIWKKEREIIKYQKRKIKELENEIANRYENDDFYDESQEKLVDELKELDPYNDMFHLGCKNWPNCDTEGCGEGEGYLI